MTLIDKIKNGMRSKPIKIITLILCYMMLITSLIGTIIYLFYDHGIIGIVISIVAPSLSGFVVFWAIIPTIIIIRLQFWEKKKRAITVFVIGAFIILTSFYPYYSIPLTIYEAEAEMTATYNTAYTNLDTTNMMQFPYNIWEEFNPQNYAVIETRNIRYTNTSYGDVLMYDSYLPANLADLPDNSVPVIVNIHGGGWAVGSRGAANVQQRSKYLASKGYAVYDISYGLYSLSGVVNKLNLTPAATTALQGIVTSLMGISGVENFIPTYKHDYTIPEQVQNIAAFFLNLSTYIKATNTKINLDKVYTMGLSAGGHLSSIVATGYNSSVFGSSFPDNITIIGGIHYYPPTDFLKFKASLATGRLGGPIFGPLLQSVFDVFYNASGATLAQLLVNYSAAYMIQETPIKGKPDLIILHGNKDNLCPYYDQGVTFKFLAKQWGYNATLITVHGGGHAFDLTFPSPGYQITLYYIERFLAITS